MVSLSEAKKMLEQRKTQINQARESLRPDQERVQQYEKENAESKQAIDQEETNLWSQKTALQNRGVNALVQRKIYGETLAGYRENLSTREKQVEAFKQEILRREGIIGSEDSRVQKELNKIKATQEANKAYDKGISSDSLSGEAKRVLEKIKLMNDAYKKMKDRKLYENSSAIEIGGRGFLVTPQGDIVKDLGRPKVAGKYSELPDPNLQVGQNINELRNNISTIQDYSDFKMVKTSINQLPQINRQSITEVPRVNRSYSQPTRRYIQPKPLINFGNFISKRREEVQKRVAMNMFNQPKPKQSLNLFGKPVKNKSKLRKFSIWS